MDSAPQIQLAANSKLIKRANTTPLSNWPLHEEALADRGSSRVEDFRTWSRQNPFTKHTPNLLIPLMFVKSGAQ